MSRDKVNRMELLICYIFSQLNISCTKNNLKKDFMGVIKSYVVYSVAEEYNVKTELRMRI